MSHSAFPAPVARRHRGPQRAAAAAACAALAAAAVLAGAGEAAAFPGDPDARFGVCGDAVSGIGVNGPAGGFALAPDGTSWLAGVGGLPRGGSGALLSRLDAHGTPDPTFGQAGVLALGSSANDTVTALVRDTDGAMIIGGSVGGAPYVWRVPAGGGAPTGTALPAPATGSVLGLALRPDHSIAALTAGGAVMSLTAALAADQAFGAAGAVSGPVGVLPAAVAARPDGSLIVAGTGSGHVATFRLARDGSVDTGFGTVTTDFSGLLGGARSDRAVSVSVLGDGSTLVGAISAPANSAVHQIATVKLTPTGAPDARFGSTGRVLQDLHEDELLTGAVVQPDGKVLLVGQIGGADNSDVLVSRLNADGTPDTGFGFGGVVYHDRGGADTVAGAGLTSEGTLVVGGTVSAGARRLALTRLRTAAETGPTGYIADGWGGTHPWSAVPADTPACLKNGSYWAGWDITRGMAELPDVSGAFTLDGWGGLHFSTPYPEMVATPTVSGGPYWNGWDIARGVAVMPDGTSGFVLDGWGGVHGFGINGGTPAVASGGAYWSGWDITRGLAVLPDGTGGYVLDGWGGLHPFGIAGHAAPPAIADGTYWPGWDIARSVTLEPDGSGGYVLDGWGGTHPFTVPGHTTPASPTSGPYWSGWDIARGLAAIS